MRAAAGGSVQTLNLGTGVTRVQDPTIAGVDRVAVALTRAGVDEIVTTSALGGPPTTRVNAAVSGFTTLGRQNYPTTAAAIDIPPQLGGNVGAVALNRNGIVAFTAKRPSINTFRGIYTGPNFVADKVIQTGDALFGSTVVDVAFGNEGLNDSMQVAFLALLADGSSVVARADLPGSTQANAILPSLALPGGGFAFVDVQSGLWFDPPIVDSFLYHMTSNSLFTKILDFPTGFTSPFQVLVGNSLLGIFGPGQSVDFLALLGRGVTDFTIRGISPMVDAQNPLAFPLRLEFNTPLASFTMTPIVGPSTGVPEPSALVLTATGVVGLGLIARRRQSRSTPPRGLVT